MTVRITQDHGACIGCGACAAVCPDFWEMGGDGKSHLKGSKEKGGVLSLDVKEEGCNLPAAQSCPVNCIHIENGGKKII